MDKGVGCGLILCFCPRDVPLVQLGVERPKFVNMSYESDGDLEYPDTQCMEYLPTFD